MEPVYIVAIFVSTFLHCMGIFYVPTECCSDSVVFIIMATMFLHKLKVENDIYAIYRNALDMVIECVIICLIMQVLLLFIWFPVHKVLEVVVDSVCAQNPRLMRFYILYVLKDYITSMGVLAIESIMIFKIFVMEDVQKFYGCEDDLLSASTISIVAKQQKLVQRRQEKMRRR